MIYITGDTHGHQDRFDVFNRYLTKRDILIIVGDFSFIFRNNEKEHTFLDELANLPYKICFIDGNHENFDYLNCLPVEQWNGGKVHFLRKNIIHLMRGQIYTIKKHTFFTFGGAFSPTRHMGIKGYNWWEEELPSSKEYQEALENLKAHDFKVDYILSHTCPKSTIYYMNMVPVRGDRDLIEFLQMIENQVTYQHWYFGHFHIDKKINKMMTCLLFNMVNISNKKVIDTYYDNI